MQKIVFILNNYVDSKSSKRIAEFQKEGFDVDVYCFDRHKVAHQKFDYPVSIIGVFSDDVPYIKRIGIIRKGIASVVSKFSQPDPITYYIDGLGVASVACFMIKHPYIYEECDLVHTYIHNPIVRKAFDVLDKRIIARSLETILTSEGFAQYHFGGVNLPHNVSYIFNKLNPKIEDCAMIPKRETDMQHLRFAFVGQPRFKSVYSFAHHLLKNFPQHEFHLYGAALGSEGAAFQDLNQYPNFFTHGRFKNPTDLPAIYADIDVVISTYDVEYVNVQYAEPNKIYEAIYFATPIVATNGTYLANKVCSLGVGFAIDPLDEQAVVDFVNGLTLECLKETASTAQTIDKRTLIDDNRQLMNKLKQKLQ